MRKLKPTIILSKHELELAERNKRIEQLEKELEREITYKDALEKAESSLRKLKEAVEKHHAEVWGDYWKIEDCADIELYKVLEEIKLP